jgi:signal transduction histidine kinase
MSYQTIKRALGETSLERKCRFLFGVCLLVLITASFSWYGAVTERLVREQNRTTGRFLVDQVLNEEHFEAMLPAPQQNQIDIYKQVNKNVSKQSYEKKFIFPPGSTVKGPPHEVFEFSLLDRFMKGRPADLAPHEQEYAEQVVDDKKFYEYYQAVRADDLCIVCHLDSVRRDLATGNLGGSSEPGAVPLAKGDLMAIVMVKFSNDRTQGKLAENRAILVATAIITAFLAMMASYVIVRYVIVKPLRHLRDVSDAISHGNVNLRAEIHTGDEFEGLALAFNRMLRHLVSVQEELRQVNGSLDGKVDELAQANMRLYEMNRIKSEFLATMSHELRTPLNSILGFSEVLKGIDALDEKQKRYVQNIQKSGRTLLDMINDILDLAKIESGKMDVRLSDFRVEQVVVAQCDMARPLTEKKNIDLEAQIEPDLPPLHQDQARVQQVLNNLLSNAIKFTPEGGRIKIVARRDDRDLLALQVMDTGVGIAEEDQQSIFEKFRQGRTGQPSGDAMTREYSGTGLGLSIVKELCKLLGGEVSVESVLGKGSTFTVRLPWKLEEQPRLDSPLADGFDEFAKGRFELPREIGKGSLTEHQSTP